MPKSISVRNVTIFFIIMASILLIAHLFHLYLYYAKGIYIDKIDLNYEKNIPTYFQMLSLLFSSYLIGIIAVFKMKAKDRFFYLWTLLSLIFIFLGLDEGITIHDRLSEPVRKMLKTPDALFFAWVVPYAIFVIVFGISFLKFYLHLPKRFKVLFFLSASIYVFGVLVMEVIGASRTVKYGRADYLYATCTTIEEALEMAGIVIFNYTLLLYIALEYKDKLIRFAVFKFKVIE